MSLLDEVLKLRAQLTEEMVLMFAALEGIVLPVREEAWTFEGRKKLRDCGIEIVNATHAGGDGSLSYPTDSTNQIIEETWCINRKTHPIGYEKTWPRVLTSRQGLSLTVKLQEMAE